MFKVEFQVACLSIIKFWELFAIKAIRKDLTISD